MSFLEVTNFLFRVVEYGMHKREEIESHPFHCHLRFKHEENFEMYSIVTITIEMENLPSLRVDEFSIFKTVFQSLCVHKNPLERFSVSTNEGALEVGYDASRGNLGRENVDHRQNGQIVEFSLKLRFDFYTNFLSIVRQLREYCKYVVLMYPSVSLNVSYSSRVEYHEMKKDICNQFGVDRCEMVVCLCQTVNFQEEEKPLVMCQNCKNYFHVYCMNVPHEENRVQFTCPVCVNNSGRKRKFEEEGEPEEEFCIEVPSFDDDDEDEEAMQLDDSDDDDDDERGGEAGRRRVKKVVIVEREQKEGRNYAMRLVLNHQLVQTGYQWEDDHDHDQDQDQVHHRVDVVLCTENFGPVRTQFEYIKFKREFLGDGDLHFERSDRIKCFEALDVGAIRHTSIRTRSVWTKEVFFEKKFPDPVLVLVFLKGKTKVKRIKKEIARLCKKLAREYEKSREREEGERRREEKADQMKTYVQNIASSIQSILNMSRNEAFRAKAMRIMGVSEGRDIEKKVCEILIKKLV